MNRGKDLLIKLILALLTTMQLSSSIYGSELTMGYRTSERQPYIQATPNIEGVYQALYSAGRSVLAVNSVSFASLNIAYSDR